MTLKQKIFGGVVMKGLKVLVLAMFLVLGFSISSYAEDENSYNHNGKLDDTFVTGINLTFSF
jgi:hypothetical protein